jgi:hypothetical protein
VTFNTATTVAIANTGGSALSVAGNITGGNVLFGSGIVSGTGTVQAANAIISGAVSANINVAGVALRTVASTYTDNTTAASSTAGDNHINVLATPTLAATNLTVTSTRAATLYIAGAPAAGTNMTITNAYALYAAAGNVVAIANISGGNLLTSGLISAAGNITGGNIITGSGTGGSITGADLITATTLSATGNITGGNVLFGSGIVSGTGNITGGNVISAALNSTGNVTITSTAANAWVFLTPTGTGTIQVDKDITNGQANGVGNIGNATGYFNTVFAKATSAQYADLAEIYAADQEYLPGTVLSFGGNKEVTMSDVYSDNRVAGVVSTNPSYVMNAVMSDPYATAVALTGRVPTSVTGQVRKGDMMISHGDGTATACSQPAMGTVIGKALEDFDGSTGTIEIVVGRL